MVRIMHKGYAHFFEVDGTNARYKFSQDLSIHSDIAQVKLSDDVLTVLREEHGVKTFSDIDILT